MPAPLWTMHSSSQPYIDLKKYDVHFDASLGKNDPYMDKHYRHLSRVIQHAQNGVNIRWLGEHHPKELLDLSRRTYEKYKPSVVKTTNTIRIPRVFHHIWVGNKPLPEKYKAWQKGWQSIPGWEYKLWTDKEVAKLTLQNKELYYKETNMGARSDILRIEILYQFGGVYIDTDFEVYEPKMFDFLSSAYDFFCGFHSIDSLLYHKVLAYNNAIIGSIPRHPILKAWLDKRKSLNPQGDIIEKGPSYFTIAVLENADKGYRDIIFPPTFFYPVGNKQMFSKTYRKIHNPAKKLARIKQDACKKETIAIHWWDGSWYKP